MKKQLYHIESCRQNDDIHGILLPALSHYSLLRHPLYGFGDEFYVFLMKGLEIASVENLGSVRRGDVNV
jgi:hypothetical protein